METKQIEHALIIPFPIPLPPLLCPIRGGKFIRPTAPAPILTPSAAADFWLSTPAP